MTLQCGLVRFISSIYNKKHGRAAVYTLYSTLDYGFVNFISLHHQYQSVQKSNIT